MLNYTGYKYSEIPHADFGFMVREDAMSGEIFEPSTVENKISLNNYRKKRTNDNQLIHSGNYKIYPRCASGRPFSIPPSRNNFIRERVDFHGDTVRSDVCCRTYHDG